MLAYGLYVEANHLSRSFISATRGFMTHCLVRFFSLCYCTLQLGDIVDYRPLWSPGSAVGSLLIVRVSVSVSLCSTITNEMTFDLDIWLIGSSWPCLGQMYRLKSCFKVRSHKTKSCSSFGCMWMFTCPKNRPELKTVNK